MYERMPSGMEEYLATYGWHFSKKLCQWAVSRMKYKDERTGQDQHVQMMSKEDLDTMFQRFGVDPTEFTGYDAVYVFHMAKADFGRGSLSDDHRLIMYVKEYLQDPDGYDEIAMTRYYADCIGRGEMPDWEECI